MNQSPLYSSSLIVDQILYVQAQGNYLYIHFDGTRGKQLIRSTLKKLESQLSGSTVVRVHNSYLANLRKVIKLQSNELFFYSGNQQSSIPVSRKYIKQVKLKLEALLSRQGEITYTANDPGYPF